MTRNDSGLLGTSEVSDTEHERFAAQTNNNTRMLLLGRSQRSRDEEDGIGVFFREQL